MEHSKAIALALLVLAGVAGAARLEKERPVMKVVRMLQDMREQLQRDLDDDKAVHESLDCWCKTNNREKAEAIQTGEARSSELEAFMGSAKAKMAEIKAKRDATLDEVNNDEEALHKARNMRMKENKEFHAEETHLVEAAMAADQAITVLGQHHPELAQLRAAADRLRNADVLSLGASNGLKSAALKAFVEQREEGVASFLAIPGFQSYRPQSGQIFGILKQMKADFERRLAEARETEGKDVADFDSLKAAKEQEIAIGRKMVSQLEQDFADWGEKHVQAFKENEATEEQLALDQTFLKNLKQKCSESDAEFDARVKSRMEEINAVDDTIAILNEDQAFDVFDKTVNTAFLQTSSRTTEEEQARRQRAASVLALAAGHAKSPRLSLLATMVRLDAFTKVKEEIDKMVALLQKQQEDEISHRDWCIKELNDNNRSTEEAYDKKAGLEAKIADLKKSIEALSKQIAATTKEVAETQEQMKRASETREAENAEFQQTAVDQRTTQVVLRKALDRMAQVYALLQREEPPQPGAAHAVLSGNHTDPGNGPARFTKYGQNAGGSRVLAALETIIKDSVTALDKAMASEEDAQTAYEEFMKDSNKFIALSLEKLADMSEARAKNKEELVMTETDLKQTVSELEDLHNTNGNLHKSCDFIMDNFDARQSARAAEVDALKQAKAILSGMQ